MSPSKPYQNKALPYVLGIMTAYLLLMHREWHLWLNAWHNPWLDWFFKYFTHLGDGIAFGVLIVAFLFINRKIALKLTIAGILIAIFVSFLFKQVIFDGAERPYAYFDAEKLALVSGVEMGTINSFPSGHTTTIFAIFFLLRGHLKKTWQQYLYWSIPVLIGFSRMYLSQHFLIDVLAGGLLGVVFALWSESLSQALLRQFKK